MFAYIQPGIAIIVKRVSKWMTYFSLAIIILAASFPSSTNVVKAQSSNNVTLRVIIESVRALDCFDNLLFICESAPDFYAR